MFMLYCTASLSRICFGAGIMFAHVITLCHDDNIRVVSGSLDVVSRLRDIIIWGYMFERWAANGDSSVQVFLRACI